MNPTSPPTKPAGPAAFAVAATPPSAFSAAQWRQLLLITVGAAAIFAGLRLLPTGTNLSHMDFRVDPKAGNAIEFCDPLNPQFIPVTAARSPVTLAVAVAVPAVTGREVQATVTLKTGSGKPVEPADLLVTHTRRLHLLLVDPTLTDYQHVHPEPTRNPGEWAFTFTPRSAGTYRIFGDFTPAATGRGLYSSVDLAVTTAAGGAAAALPAVWAGRYERDGFIYTLTSRQRPARAGQPIDLQFEIGRTDGGAVPLEPVMGAFAHLVAFDEGRTGFAHLHPAEADLTRKPDAVRPVLNFKLTIPSAGRFIVWAQINLGGTETFAPFELRVE
jgi:hypothetical protein